MDEQGSSSVPRPCPGCEERDRRISELESRVKELERKLEEALRAPKRQAAPFSKGEPKANPKRPGRKPGAAYGRVAHRRRPSHVDERSDVPLPDRYPCGGLPIDQGVEPQWQVDVPKVNPHVTQFDVHVGRCLQCGQLRSMLVCLAREHGGLAVRDLARRLHRTPSVVSRLYAAYAEGRDPATERKTLEACHKIADTNA